MGALLFQTPKLFYFYLKRNKFKIFLWLTLLTILTLLIPPAFENMYSNEAKMGPIIEMSKNPAMEVMLGPGDFNDVNIGVLFAHEMTLFTGIMVAIMNILIVARDTRGDEADGKTEILKALPIGKHAPLISHLLMNIFSNGLLAILFVVGLTCLNTNSIDFSGALVYGFSMGVFGLMFSGLTMVIAQLVSSGGETAGMSIAILLLMYLVRAFGDIANEQISMYSPMGWLSRVYAFSENNWWPIITMLVVTILMYVIALALNHIRDINAKMLPQLPSRKRATWYMKSPLGLQIKLQKAGFCYFAIGLFVLGLSYGSIFGDLDRFFKDNPLLQSMLSDKGNNYVEQFLPQLMLVMSLISTIPSLMSLFKIKKSIDMGYAMLVLANTVSRINFLSSFLILSIINAIVMISLAALGLYVGQVYALENAIDFGTIMQSAMIFIPAILVFVGLGTLVIGWGIKFTNVVYLYLAYTFVVNYLGVLLNVKAWMKDITPFNHIPNIPVDDFKLLPLVILTIIATMMCIIGIIGFKQRDL